MPHRPILRVLRYVVVLLILASCYFVGVYFGRETFQSVDTAKIHQLEQNAASQSQEAMQLRTNAEVDHQSMEELRQQVMTLRAQLAAADRDMRVYKYLLTPGGRANPWIISFGLFTVMPLKEEGHYNYKLVVQKLSSSEADFSGSLQFRIVGRQAGKSVKLALNQVSSQATAVYMPLNFKYFQTLEGDMQLPVDFTPQSVELVVNAGEEKNSPIVENQLEWPSYSH